MSDTIGESNSNVRRRGGWAGGRTQDGWSRDVPAVRWRSDYANATTVAERDSKMLFIYFCDAAAGSPCDRFKKETLDDPQVRRKLQDYVCLRLPLSAKITVQGKPVVLLEHDAFREMLGRPGIAVVDYRTNDAKLRGLVVSQFPITDTLWYTPERMAVILTLPPGTLTQRTLIYAVRIHPDNPASTDGEPLPALVGGSAGACAVSGQHPRAGASVLGIAFSAHPFPPARRRFATRGVRRELGLRKSGGSGHRVRPLLAMLVGTLERRAVAEPFLRLRHEARRQRRVVRDGDCGRPLGCRGRHPSRSLIPRLRSCHGVPEVDRPLEGTKTGESHRSRVKMISMPCSFIRIAVFVHTHNAAQHWTTFASPARSRNKEGLAGLSANPCSVRR